ncbi:GNAT family N-acetyltransferase [Gluconacetobacter asukensis]
MLLNIHKENQLFYSKYIQPVNNAEHFNLWYDCVVAGTHGRQVWVVKSAQDKQIIGVVTVSDISRSVVNSAILGWYGDMQFLGRGIYTNAVASVVDHLFREVGLRRLEGVMHLERV